MTSVTMQRDLVVNLKKETHLNIGILSKLRPMPTELTRQIFKENALEKPTQNIFNHLSYYLVAIIDSNVADKFSWPLYDTKTERTFRTQLSVFVTDYSSKGLLSPVMSSYLVNPGCFKVTMLIFQMSQLAVQRVLTTKMAKESQKELYNNMTSKYKTGGDSFLEDISKETDVMSSKFSNYLRKRDAMEKIASIFREKIVSMEKALESTNAQQVIDNIVDKYVNERCLDEASKSEILKIKDVKQHSAFFDYWLEYYDKRVLELESKWEEKVSPFLSICENCQKNTEALISRSTGEADRNSFMIEYNHSTDEICTTDLQKEVNSQQKYILKNIVKDGTLYFPNLVRGFLISICYILKNTEIGDEIYKFNEYLESSHTSLEDIVSTMRSLIDRVATAEKRIEASPISFNQSTSSIEFEIPPLPDLSNLKANRDSMCQFFNTFTPLSTTKHQFNLLRKHNSFSFTKPKSIPIITPFHKAPRDDFLKSCRTNSYDHNATHNFHNISIISQGTHRSNETINECSAGFTKQQIMRLLSTKKSSSSKKQKYKLDRPDINIKKGGLFNDTTLSNDSNGLFRSYSSPNLYENREKRDKKSFATGNRRKMVIQDVNPILEVSGIVALEKDEEECFKTPESDNVLNLENPLSEATSLPVIVVTPIKNQTINDIVTNIEEDFNKKMDENFLLQYEPKEVRKSWEKEETKAETPTDNNVKLQKRTNSLEKIINRFKKVRANVITTENKDEEKDIKTIAEEKEINNMNVNVDVFTANRILLPDLLSPSCNGFGFKSTDILDQFCMDIDDCEGRKPRQSLGTALGVDETFLDQFDLVD